MKSDPARALMAGTFLWHVPAEGFCWVEARDVEGERVGRYLVPAELSRHTKPVDPSVAERPYDPMTKGGLFLRFAELQPTEADVLEFANQHGELGQPRDGLGNVVRLGNRAAVQGTSLSLWTEKIWEVHRAVTLWRALGWGDSDHRGTPDRAWLEERVQVGRDAEGVFAHFKNEPRDKQKPFPLYDPTELIFDTRPDWSHHHKVGWHTKGDVVGPAREFLRQQITKALRAHSALELRYMTRSDQLRLQPMPKNLLGALWLQLARAIDGNREYRRCMCGEVFEVSLEAKVRKSRKHCSVSCKVKAYRDRKMRAMELSEKGKSPGAIAKALGSKLATVKGWITREVWLRKTTPRRGRRRDEGSRREPVQRGRSDPSSARRRSAGRRR